MTPTPTHQELTLTLLAPDSKPILLTPTFLQGSHIIPDDWQLARQPHLTPQLAQIAFTNGITLTAHPGSIAFTENIPIDNDQLPMSNDQLPMSNDQLPIDNCPSLKIPDIACNYIQTQPHLNYQTLTINPRTFIAFPQSENDAARNSITRLLAPAPWQKMGTAPLKTHLTLTFTFERRQLNLSIAEVQLQREGNPPQNALLFSGNYTYPIEANSAGEKFEQLKAYSATIKLAGRRQLS